MDGMDDDADFDRLSRAVYLAARAGALDCTAAFDLAASWLEERPQNPDAVEPAGLSDAEELAALSLECTQADTARMAEVALRLLARYFAPGFDEEPGWPDVLGDAMRVVNRDVAATGLRPCLLRVHDGENARYGNAYVETWDGYTGVAQGVYPSSGADPVSALLAVADDAQDAIAHMLFAAWPVCSVHRLGVHPRAREEDAVWWCAGDGGHPAGPLRRPPRGGRAGQRPTTEPHAA